MAQTNISLEKVFGGLECCATDRKRREDCEAISCPYLNLESHGCIHQLIRDAFALLKADLQAQREAQAAIETDAYMEQWEPTYNPEDGSL